MYTYIYIYIYYHYYYPFWGIAYWGQQSAAGGHLWCPYFKDITVELVTEAHNLGLPVCTWTVNEVEDIENMIDMGIDGIITDYTDRAKKIFKSRGLSWQ